MDDELDREPNRCVRSPVNETKDKAWVEAESVIIKLFAPYDRG
jgi:hypothetical protein